MHKEELLLLKKNSFLEKELALKTRELEIEASLERVRAKTMSMRKPSEFVDVIDIMGEQFIHLGFDFDWVNFSANGHDVSKAIDIWNFVVVPGLYQGATRLVIPFFEHPVFIKAGESIKEYNASGNNFTVVLLDKKDKDTFLDHLFTNTIFKDLPDEAKTSQYNREVYQTSNVVLKDTWLSLGKYDATPLTDEQITILKRLANAFGQAYTRFLDLQKAEAQAREAHIEAALERVRSRTMAMHKSSELLDVIKTLGDQFQLLGFKIHSANFNTSYRQKDWNLWLYNPGNPVYPEQVHIPYLDNPFFNRTLESIASGSDFNAFVFTKEEKDDFLDHLYAHTIARNSSEERKKFTYDAPGFAWSTVYLKNTALTIANYDAEPFTEEQNAIIRRFGNAFEQTYTRFLDLQKAEAQAREAQIELGLERVRARAMAMLSSLELKEVVKTLFEELRHLDVNVQACLIATFDAATFDQRSWMIHLKTNEPYAFLIPHNEQPFYQEMLKAWKERNANWAYVLEGETKIKWEDFLFADTDFRLLPKSVKEEMQKPEKVFFAASYYTYGAIQSSSPAPFSKQSIDILQRFSKVFDSCYTRFLDLQKAEAQAREAQIELGLERVRARAMAMQNSDELKELIGTVFTELTKLDLVLTRCVIMIYDIKTLGITWWMANSEDPSNPAGLFVKYHKLPPNLSYIKAWKERDLKWQYILEGKIKKDWDNFLFVETELSHLPDFVIAGMKAPDRVYLNASFNSFGNLTLATLEPLSNEHADILLRFAKVFDLTYTRFNDLQKAEAQARESQIQLALERVRARTMAMQHSNELSETTAILFRQMNELGNTPERLNIGIINEDKGLVETWATEQGGHQINHSFNARLDEPTTIAKLYEGWKAKRTSMIVDISGDELKQWIRFLQDELQMPVKEELLQNRRVQSVAYFKEGFILITTPEPLPAENISLLERFAEVFNLTYTRFLDLQKAEAQAREATIEASLERVRGKAMSMHSSRDLADTIDVFYHEMELLSVTPRRCGVGLMNKETHVVELSTMNTTEQGESIEVIGKLKLTGHLVLEGIYDNWILQKEYHPVLRGNEIKKYYQLIRPQISYPDYPTDTAQYGYFFFFNEGGVYAWTEKELSEDELQIYRRFTSVLSLTYKRYKDLERAEASTKEALKQSALDRIRADIASMRTVSDLDRITPLIWNELTILGVPFIRCGVFIMDDEEQQIHTFLSTPEGKGIAAFHLPYNTPGNIAHVISHWYKKEIYTDHWDEEAFKDFAEILVHQGSMESSKQYLQTMPAGGFNLHFVPFQQGMLYVGNTAPLAEEEMILLQSIADAFSTAYARYEDFNKLEAAKKQVDNALTELKQAQQQLVQSEKMASLGELTAGIAHEIQNPLNFVNNFSEVNTEMLEELKAERLKPNEERDESLQDDLINDVIENSEKILHHGKRADAIVKGMLQHSRKSSGQKEPTDINALADEYLRLSYHGLRAKDKNFNATIETDFDKSIGKINVIPQDIGRVLLNLFNNAFYAVNEQKNKNFILYEPTVFVHTQKCDNKIQITVRDNGNGIPQKIIDKIFQPFFTTKPTGEGTGLGLSLSYDIIKAHGGEIKVESKESEGTEFIIQLPMI